MAMGLGGNGNPGACTFWVGKYVGVYIVQTVPYSRRMNRGQTAS